MRNKTLIICALLLLACGPVLGQSASPEVIANAGTHSVISSAQVSWTVGEAVTQTFTGSGEQLTQGFHQTNLIVIGVEDGLPEFEVMVFPNPATDFLNVEWQQSLEQLDISLANMQGQVLRKFPRVSGPAFRLDMNGLSQGHYLLQVAHRGSAWQKTWNIEVVR